MVRHRQTSEVFESEFLPVRAKLLEIAASLDRLDRAEGSVDGDPRRSQIGNAIETLLRAREDSADDATGNQQVWIVKVDSLESRLAEQARYVVAQPLERLDPGPEQDRGGRWTLLKLAHGARGQ